jgi:hypothetical protein
MKSLRLLLIGTLAAAALVAGSANAVAVESTVDANDACDADGSTDTGANALNTDKDLQVQGDADEQGTMHEAQASTDKGNGECGTSEDSEKDNHTSGAGTHGDSDDKANSNQDDGQK